MFKKIALVCALFASASSAYAVSPGVYVGADAGVNYAMFKDSGDAASANFGDAGAMADIFIGYGGIVNQNIYLGVEIFGAAASSDVDGIEADGGSLEFDTNNSYGASFIPGVLLTDCTMAYARIGVIRTGFEVKGTAAGGGEQNSANETSTGGQAGLGVQTRISKNLDIRGEYDFTSYQSFHEEDDKISPTSGQVKLGLVYHFD